MLTLLAIGLILALAGSPILLELSRRRDFDPLAPGPRLALWILAAIIFVVAMMLIPQWSMQLGLGAPGWRTLGAGLVATVATLAGWPLIQLTQRWLGVSGKAQLETFQKIAKMPFFNRVFLVLTAGITEELLYRGYGIGVGSLVLGTVQLATVCSMLAFVGSHFRWGVGHALSVFWATAVLSAAFVLTNDLFACILAHLLVDSAGFLLAPWAMAKRAQRKASASGV